MSPEEFGQRLQIDTPAGENSLCFEDFETEIERADEASRGPSRVPSDTGLLEDTVPSRGSGASSTVSGLFSAPPALTSTPTYMHSPGTQNESSACESAPEASFLSAGLNDEVLLRLAKMVAEEISAEKEKLRVVLHDVGVQTADEGPSPSTRPDGLVPALVSSSTQTLSTGGIKSEELFIN